MVFIHSLGRLEVSPFRARQKFNGHLLKAAHCFQVESCARFHRLRNFGGFRMLLDGFPCVCTHWKKKKKAPSSQPLPGSSALQWVFSPSGTKSRPADGSLYPWCCGCQAVGLWRDWPLVRDRAVDHNGLRLCLFRHESTRWGGLSGTAGIEPGPPTLCIPPHIKPSTWDGKQQVPHASHPSALRNMRSRSREPAAYLLRVLGVSEEEDEKHLSHSSPARIICCHIDKPLKLHALL